MIDYPALASATAEKIYAAMLTEGTRPSLVVQLCVPILAALRSVAEQQREEAAQIAESYRTYTDPQYEPLAPVENYTKARIAQAIRAGAAPAREQEK